MISLKLGRVGAAGLLALTLLTACQTGGSDSAPNTAPGASAPAANEPAANPSLKTDLCAAVDAVDVSSLLGSGPIDHLDCFPSDQMGALAQAVWTRTSDGVRISITVISNHNADGQYANFDVLASTIDKEFHCQVKVMGAERRCLDVTLSAGNFTIDMGDSHVNVWQSQEGTSAVGGMALPSDRARQVRDFAVNTVVPALYS